MEKRAMQKRDAILNSALELIAEHGFHGAPAAMIAQRAKVGVGTIYRYFDNKDDLVETLFGEIEKKIRDHFKIGYQGDLPVRDRFIRIGRLLLGYFLENPVEFRFLEQFINSPYGVALRRERIFGKSAENADLLRELFADGKARGVVKDLPLVVLYSLAIGPLLMISRDHILGFVSVDGDLMDAAVDACWQAIKC